MREGTLVDDSNALRAMARRAEKLAQTAIDPEIITSVLTYARDLHAEADALEMGSSTDGVSITYESAGLAEQESRAQSHYRDLADQAIRNSVMAEDADTAAWFLAFAKTMAKLADALRPPD